MGTLDNITFVVSGSSTGTAAVNSQASQPGRLIYSNLKGTDGAPIPANVLSKLEIDVNETAITKATVFRSGQTPLVLPRCEVDDSNR
jgi:hypothetical protein